jgi:hypothetical protein
MKQLLLFVLFVALVLGFFFAITGKRAAYIPADDAHRGLTAQEACLTCHAPGMEAPLKKDHPPKVECLKCHKRKPGTK